VGPTTSVPRADCQLLVSKNRTTRTATKADHAQRAGYQPRARCKGIQAQYIRTRSSLLGHVALAEGSQALRGSKTAVSNAWNIAAAGTSAAATPAADASGRGIGRGARSAGSRRNGRRNGRGGSLLVVVVVAVAVRRNRLCRTGERGRTGSCGGQKLLVQLIVGLLDSLSVGIERRSAGASRLLDRRAARLESLDDSRSSLGSGRGSRARLRARPAAAVATATMAVTLG
jgi:hypothetical protein